MVYSYQGGIPVRGGVECELVRLVAAARRTCEQLRGGEGRYTCFFLDSLNAAYPTYRTADLFSGEEKAISPKGAMVWYSIWSNVKRNWVDYKPTWGGHWANMTTAEHDHVAVGTQWQRPPSRACGCDPA